jgi:hypothetical protein
LDYFTKDELKSIKSYLYPKQNKNLDLKDSDILQYLLEMIDHRNKLFLQPTHAYVESIIYQRGLYGHYLYSKDIKDWDSYDLSNFNSMRSKTGNAKIGYGIFTKLDQGDHEQLTVRWFSSDKQAQIKRLELLESKHFSDDQLYIHKDLRPLY